MKTITKLSFIAAAMTLLGASASLADDQQLHNRLALERTRDQQDSQRTTTIAVYANERGVGSSAMQNERSEPRFELRYDAHGRTYGAYLPAE